MGTAERLIEEKQMNEEGQTKKTREPILEVREIHSILIDSFVLASVAMFTGCCTRADQQCDIHLGTVVPCPVA